jgi:agmatinase
VNGELRGFLEDKLDSQEILTESARFIEAIIEASGHIELLDESLRIDASAFGVRTLRPSVNDLRSVTAHVSDLCASEPDALLGFLGGEHSITPAIIEGLTEKELGIVWIDAHADLRESFHGRKDNHACAAYNSIRFGRIVQLGTRSLAAEEAAFLERSDQVRSFRHWGSAAKDALRALPNTVYLTIDADGLSPTLMRAVGTPEPGGFAWDEVLDILDFVFREKTVRAFDMVELCPDERDVVSSYTASRLVYKVMAYHAYYRLRGRQPPSRAG